MYTRLFSGNFLKTTNESTSLIFHISQRLSMTVIESQSYVHPCSCGGGFVVKGKCLNKNHDTLLKMAENYKNARLEEARQSLKDLKEMVQSGKLDGLEYGIAKAQIDYGNGLQNTLRMVQRSELSKMRDQFLSYGIDPDGL